MENRVSKDFGIPITVFADKTIFNHQVNVLNMVYPIKHALELAKEIPDFFNTRNLFFDNAVNIIRNNPKFSEFLEKDLSIYGVKNSPYAKNNSNLFSHLNHGKIFTSIDLCEANYQVCRDFGIIEFDKWKDFAKSISHYDYFKEAKKLRQIIFGTVSKSLPGRLKTIQRFYIESIANDHIDPLDICNISEDELIIRGNFKDLQIYGFDAKVKTFELNRIGNTSMYYKKYEDGAFDLKCVPSTYVCQVIKHITKQPIEPFDMIFSYEGKLAKFLEGIV